MLMLIERPTSESHDVYGNFSGEQYDSHAQLPPLTGARSLMPSRRRLLTLAATAGTAAWCLPPSSLAAEEVAFEDTAPKTPAEALEKLYAGNRRFVAGKSAPQHRDLTRLKEIAPKQAPFAAFLGCADSRVPIEIVFDQGFGDLFVSRIAGNVASSENIGSLEFGTLVLGAKVLYVLGHTSCGAVSATLKRQAVPGQISGLFQHIRPSIRSAGGDLDLAVRENVKYQALVLAESSPVLSQLIREGKLVIAGGVYDLQTGRVTPVEIPQIQ